MNTREDMDAAIRKIVLPEVRQLGYKGSLPHLRRITDRVDLLTFQFDPYGGGFFVEAGSGPKEGITMSWGKFIPAEKMRAWDLPADQRARLPLGTYGKSQWFRFDDGDDCETVARAALKVIMAHERERA